MAKALPIPELPVPRITFEALFVHVQTSVLTEMHGFQTGVIDFSLLWQVGSPSLYPSAGFWLGFGKPRHSKPDPTQQQDRLLKCLQGGPAHSLTACLEWRRSVARMCADGGAWRRGAE
jgi:hypothetical protein